LFYFEGLTQSLEYQRGGRGRFRGRERERERERERLAIKKNILHVYLWDSDLLHGLEKLS
jgi:hypothetical protein